MRFILLLLIIFALSPVVLAAPAEIILTFTGDCTLGSDEHFGYEGTLPAIIDTNYGDLSYVFRSVAPIFASDDLTVINLEGTFTSRGARQQKTFAFRGPTAYASMLSHASIEAANLANNHTCDYGVDGYTDTMAALRKENIFYFGEEHIVRTMIKGIPFALIGYLGFYADTEIKALMAANIVALKNEGRFIVACFHWGSEGSYFPDEDQKELARYAIDQGADVVIGHHPHVLQGIEFYKGRPIAYSLGNFAFGGNANPYDKRTMILQVKVTHGISTDIAVRIIPARISSVEYVNNYQPTLLTGEDKENFFYWFNGLSPVYFNGDDWISVTTVQR